MTWCDDNAIGPHFRYRWILGDITDEAETQDIEYARELMQ